jgi:citronellol/citronellal dehydrogenase
MVAPSDIYASDLLAGRVALVTGGGTNLGREAARELLAAGATVVIAGRRQEVLEEACADLGATWVQGDVREPTDRERLVDEVLERHGRLDLHVNNAGGQYFVPAEAITDKGWAAVQRLNVGGTLGMCEVVAERGFGPDGGTIVNVTVSPHGGMPAMAHTGAARAAVEALGRDLAARWAERGIAVTSLAIGRFDTASLRKYPDVLTRSIARTVPLQRLGTMQEFGWAVVLLASPLGRGLSGGTLTLDGGLDNWDGPWPTDAQSEAGVVPIEARPAPAAGAPPAPGS